MGRPVRPRVAVLDYGFGNIRSAERALARVGADVSVTSDRAAALAADGLVVPGVGAFAACMAGLRETGGDEVIARRLEDDRPVLGICVGMQVMFDFGVEHGVRTEGLRVFGGGVTRLAAERVPHMGWNTVRAGDGSLLFRGVEDEWFYFVHSYAAPTDSVAREMAKAVAKAVAKVVTVAEHGEPFAAAVESGIAMATQFHPEKSGDAGAALLENWLGTLR